MGSFRFWVYGAIAIQIISTGLAWVVNGDIISSIVVSVLMPATLALLGLAVAREFSIPSPLRLALRAESIVMLILCLVAILLSIFSSDAVTTSRPAAPVQVITIAGLLAALALLTITVSLFRTGAITGAMATVGILAGIGEAVSYASSGSLMLIALAQAVMILFLVLLTQSSAHRVAI